MLSQVVHDQADAQAQEAVHLSHPFAVAPGQVVVHRHDVDAFAPQGVQIRGHRGNQRLAFTSLHLRDPALVQHNAAQHLHPVGPHAQYPVRRFAHRRERFGQQVVFRFAFVQPLAEFSSLRLQLFVRQLPVFILERHHGFDGLIQFLQLGIVSVPQRLLQKFQHPCLLMCITLHYSIPLFGSRVQA